MLHLLFKRRDVSRNKDDCIDREAVVVSVESQGEEWTIRHHGVFWKARPVKPGLYFSSGDKVIVVTQRNRFLFIEPYPRDCNYLIR